MRGAPDTTQVTATGVKMFLADPPAFSVGIPSTVTAVVSVVPPSGTIRFTVNGSSVATVPVQGNGQATTSWTAQAPGPVTSAPSGTAPATSPQHRGGRHRQRRPIGPDQIGSLRQAAPLSRRGRPTGADGSVVTYTATTASGSLATFRDRPCRCRQHPYGHAGQRPLPRRRDLSRRRWTHGGRRDSTRQPGPGTQAPRGRPGIGSSRSWRHCHDRHLREQRRLTPGSGYRSKCHERVSLLRASIPVERQHPAFSAARQAAAGGPGTGQAHGPARRWNRLVINPLPVGWRAWDGWIGQSLVGFSADQQPCDPTPRRLRSLRGPAGRLLARPALNHSRPGTGSSLRRPPRPVPRGDRDCSRWVFLGGNGPQSRRHP